MPIQNIVTVVGKAHILETPAQLVTEEEFGSPWLMEQRE